MMYQYPDVDDKNFYEHIKNADWNDGGLEDKYLDECMQYIPVHEREIILDAGCGLGKQIPKLLPYFKQIIAIDPDPDRLEKAKIIFKSAEHIKFIAATIQNFFMPNHLNCILCSQILQHVHTQDLAIIFEQFKKLLKSKGYLVILTTNCLADQDEFLKVNCLTNEHIPLTLEAYNECVRVNDIHLPTRLFTEKTLKKLLDFFGFDIIFLKKFNGFPKIKGDNFIFARVSR